MYRPSPVSTSSLPDRASFPLAAAVVTGAWALAASIVSFVARPLGAYELSLGAAHAAMWLFGGTAVCLTIALLVSRRFVPRGHLSHSSHVSITGRPY
ncbi:MAG: hypothetical protein KC591_08330 [Gemmatimonadetes bacterium]|nr:hypothetical protein [Gemmatimonadota bacterium]